MIIVIDCGSLEDILKTCERIPESILSRMCEQMLIGLDYLHSAKKIVHRDIVSFFKTLLIIHYVETSKCVRYVYSKL